MKTFSINLIAFLFFSSTIWTSDIGDFSLPGNHSNIQEFASIEKQISYTTVRLIAHEDDNSRATVGTGFFYLDYNDPHLNVRGKIDDDRLDAYTTSFKNLNCLYTVGREKGQSGIKNYHRCYFKACFNDDTIEEPLYYCEEEDSSRLFIITNRHVLLGKDKKNPLKTPFLKFTLNFLNYTDNSLLQKSFDFPCIEGENTYYHPTLDIVAVDISDFIKNEEKQANIYLHYRAFRAHNIGRNIYTTQPLVMAGYPKGLYDKINNLPIIRAGIASTSNEYDWNGNPEFLADIPSFGGSSGSPVFIISKEECSPMDNLMPISYSSINLLGLLKGGPLYPVKNKQGTFHIPMGLGRVIKAEKVKEFIESLREKSSYISLDPAVIANIEDGDYSLDIDNE